MTYGEGGDVRARSPKQRAVRRSPNARVPCRPRSRQTLSVPTSATHIHTLPPPFPSPPSSFTMPPGAVVDAFKSAFFPLIANPRSTNSPVGSLPDLIRHGKGHNHKDTELSPPPPTTTAAIPPPDKSSHHRAQHQAQPRHEHRHHQQQQTQEPAAAPQPPSSQSQTKSQQYVREVEQIVQEEREAKDKIPQYKGLERFQLVVKMGECVCPPSFLHRSRGSHAPMVPI